MFLIHKYWIDTWVYRERDEETEHYIIEDWMCNKFEMDYFETADELLNRIDVAMDAETRLEVVPAKEVLDCPKKEWYFIY